MQASGEKKPSAETTVPAPKWKQGHDDDRIECVVAGRRAPLVKWLHIEIIESARVAQTTEEGQVLVELSVFALGDPPLVYFWFRNGELIENSFDPVLVLDPFDETMAGTYDALVVNEFGYAVAATAELVPDLPALPFTEFYFTPS